MQAKNEIDKSGFSGPGGAHDPDGSVVRDGERELIDDGAFRLGIGEGELVEPDVAGPGEGRRWIERGWRWGFAVGEKILLLEFVVNLFQRMAAGGHLGDLTVEDLSGGEHAVTGQADNPESGEDGGEIAAHARMDDDDGDDAAEGDRLENVFGGLEVDRQPGVDAGLGA